MNTDVLAKLSSDIFAEKQAFSPMGVVRGISKGLGWLGERALTKAVPGITHELADGSRAIQGASRAFSPMRAALTAGAAGIGGTHLTNNALATEGTSLNPLTWLNPQSRQGVFDNAMGQYRNQKTQANQDLDKAYLYQNNPTADNAFWRLTHGTPEQMQQRMSDQTYTGNSWWNPSLSGLNPFANSSMMTSTDQARGIQSRDEGGLDRMRSRLASRGASMDPAVRSSMEQEMAAMQQRINTRIPRADGTSSGGNSAPTGNWSNHVQPTPQQLSYFMNPNDYRNSPAPTTHIPWEQLASRGPLSIS